jgi:hypothetical protein
METGASSSGLFAAAVTYGSAPTLFGVSAHRSSLETWPSIQKSSTVQ